LAAALRNRDGRGWCTAGLTAALTVSAAILAASALVVLLAPDTGLPWQAQPPPAPAAACQFLTTGA
jgi:hypothetical protein